MMPLLVIYLKHHWMHHSCLFLWFRVETVSKPLHTAERSANNISKSSSRKVWPSVFRTYERPLSSPARLLRRHHHVPADYSVDLRAKRCWWWRWSFPKNVFVGSLCFGHDDDDGDEDEETHFAHLIKVVTDLVSFSPPEPRNQQLVVYAPVAFQMKRREKLMAVVFSPPCMNWSRTTTATNERNCQKYVCASPNIGVRWMVKWADDDRQRRHYGQTNTLSPAYRLTQRIRRPKPFRND